MTGSIWTPDAQRRRDKRWALALGTIFVAGTWGLVRVPRPLLRGHWDTSLAWMVVLACCGVAATSMWSGRQYCRVVVRVMAWALLATWALVLTSRMFPIPGVLLPVLVALTVCLYPLLVYVTEPL